MADTGNDDEDSNAWKPARQLGPDGRVTGEVPIAGVVGETQPTEANPSGLPSLDALSTGELVLDTHKPGSRRAHFEPRAYRPLVVPDSRRPTRWMLILLALGTLALAAFALIPDLQRRLPLPLGTTGLLIINSEPSGATVKIAGNAVGQTPWAGDNLWGGEVRYEISAGGYRAHWGTFAGGQDVKLNVRLTKK